MSDWLADDPGLLSATLELIDAWGDANALDDAMADAAVWSDATDPATSEPDDEPETSCQVLVPRAKSARTISMITAKDAKSPSTNQRRRHEIVDLRAQLRALQAQVQALQLGERTSEVPLPLVSLWQSVAENQLRLRRQSELEQTKLRRLLETHGAIAQGMAMLMGQSQDMRAEEAARTLKREVTVDRLRLLPHSVEQFEQIDLIYANLDTVFAHPKFHEGVNQFVDFELINHLGGEVVLVFRESWAVPFESRAVLDALWTVTLDRYEKKWRHPGPQVLIDTYEAFVAHFLARVVIDSFVYSFCGQLMLRRFAECAAGQTPAIVTSMHSPPNSDDKDAVHVTMQENSCLRVLPLVGPDGWSPISHVQTSCHISVKFDYDDETTGRFFASVLANFVLSRLKADAEVKRSTVEALLVQAQRPVATPRARF